MGGRLGQITKAVTYTGVTGDREHLLHGGSWATLEGRGEAEGLLDTVDNEAVLSP